MTQIVKIVLCRRDMHDYNDKVLNVCSCVRVCITIIAGVIIYDIIKQILKKK